MVLKMLLLIGKVTLSMSWRKINLHLFVHLYVWYSKLSFKVNNETFFSITLGDIERVYHKCSHTMKHVSYLDAKAVSLVSVAKLQDISVSTLFNTCFTISAMAYLHFLQWVSLSDLYMLRSIDSVCVCAIYAQCNKNILVPMVFLDNSTP